MIGVLVKGKMKGHLALDGIKGKDISTQELRKHFSQWLLTSDKIKRDISSLLSEDSLKRFSVELKKRPPDDRHKITDFMKANGIHTVRDALEASGKLETITGMPPGKKLSVILSESGLSKEEMVEYEGLLPSYNLLDDDNVPEPHHSHFLLVEGSSWGEEVQVRTTIENAVIDKKIVVIVGGECQSFSLFQNSSVY